MLLYSACTARFAILRTPRAHSTSHPIHTRFAPMGRYVRLFSILLYSSCTARFAILRTPRGLNELLRRGAITDAERNALLQSSMGAPFSILYKLSEVIVV